MIDQNLITRLVAAATGAGSRVYTGTAPQQSDFPLVVLRRSGGQTPRTLGGVALFSRATVGIDVLAKNYADALAVANAVRASLDGFVGLMTDTRVHSCRCTSEPTDISLADGDLVLRGITQDFSFVYQET